MGSCFSKCSGGGSKYSTSKAAAANSAGAGDTPKLVSKAEGPPTNGADALQVAPVVAAGEAAAVNGDARRERRGSKASSTSSSSSSSDDEAAKAVASEDVRSPLQVSP